VWKRSVDGRPLTFRLAGINNQNFLMRDEETGTYWQQISGKAVSGPYTGRQLELVHSDELTFGLWRRENPAGTVIRPVEEFASKYAVKDWDAKMSRTPTVINTSETPFPPRELMIGVELNDAARAYVLDRVLRDKLIQDFAGNTPVIVVVGPDNKSVRIFEARIPGREGLTDFYRLPEGDAADGALLMDSATGSRWSFQGCAVAGPSAGKCLRPVPALRDYWFDWHLYHPQTTVHGK
jgi:hypothetical protein